MKRYWKFILICLFSLSIAIFSYNSNSKATYPSPYYPLISSLTMGGATLIILPRLFNFIAKKLELIPNKIIFGFNCLELSQIIRVEESNVLNWIIKFFIGIITILYMYSITP